MGTVIARAQGLEQGVALHIPQGDQTAVGQSQDRGIGRERSIVNRQRSIGER